jgi:colanic acid/amylovoran biosynthesis glycosyltransferase
VLAAAKIILKWGWRRPLNLLRSINLFRHDKVGIRLEMLCAHGFFLETAVKARAYDIIHCHFGPAGIFGLRLRELGAMKGTLAHHISWI